MTSTGEAHNLVGQPLNVQLLNEIICSGVCIRVYVGVMAPSMPCTVDGLCTVCVSRRDVLLCSRATSTAAAIVGTCRAYMFPQVGLWGNIAKYVLSEQRSV